MQHPAEPSRQAGTTVTGRLTACAWGDRLAPSSSMAETERSGRSRTREKMEGWWRQRMEAEIGRKCHPCTLVRIGHREARSPPPAVFAARRASVRVVWRFDSRRSRQSDAMSRPKQMGLWVALAANSGAITRCCPIRQQRSPPTSLPHRPLASCATVPLIQSPCPSAPNSRRSVAAPLCPLALQLSSSTVPPSRC
jgi:hypothetical protein